MVYMLITLAISPDPKHQSNKNANRVNWPHRSHHKQYPRQITPVCRTRHKIWVKNRGSGCGQKSIEFLWRARRREGLGAD